MPRVAAFLVGLAVASLLVFFYNRTKKEVVEQLSLEQARATFVEGEYEVCKALAARVARMRPPPTAWLLEGVEHENAHVRHWSVYALGDVYASASAQADEEAVETLMRAFDDEDDWVRANAARALGNIGPPAKAALPMLRRAASDVREEIVHARAKKAVAQILGEPYDPGK